MTTLSLFQLIDLDRTLFDTSKFVKVLTDEINKTHPGLGTQLDKQFEEAYTHEETFFLLRYLRQEMGNEQFEALVAEVVARQPGHGAAFRLPGFSDRLEIAETLSKHTPGWGILTFGDYVDQVMKLRIVGLQDAPMYCTPTPNKGEIIATWQQPDGSFQLPSEFGGGVVQELTLEDDKYRAFYDLPPRAHGIWLTIDPDAAAKVDELGADVIALSSLIESGAYLQNRYK